ncbi:hypothetical protein ACFYNO_33515 [Kitasatospora sp. NPDC006697]|uniref:hypothetical protein n=1 Tax=Kitasatospora sp. NPDC006697 TaxID=3364020 RepID=UPI0036C2AD0B
MIKKTAAVAVLLAAATAAAAGTAQADDGSTWTGSVITNCGQGQVPQLPGEFGVPGAPEHRGLPALTISTVHQGRLQGDSAVFEVRITETNHTGAAYRHVSLAPSLFTQLGVMNPGNTKVALVRNGAATELPTTPGCDPSIWIASTALDAPLADGQSASFDLRITTAASVAEKIKSLMVVTQGAADGAKVSGGSFLELPPVKPAPQATPTKPATTKQAPAQAAAQSPAPTQAAQAPQSSAPAAAPAGAAPTAATPTAPATPPTPAPQQASLAFTGGGSGTGTLAAAAAALLAAGAAVLFGVKRRARRNG